MFFTLSRAVTPGPSLYHILCVYVPSLLRCVFYSMCCRDRALFPVLVCMLPSRPSVQSYTGPCTDESCVAHNFTQSTSLSLKLVLATIALYKQLFTEDSE